jgi:hypothetical protein
MLTSLKLGFKRKLKPNKPTFISNPYACIIDCSFNVNAYLVTHMWDVLYISPYIIGILQDANIA